MNIVDTFNKYAAEYSSHEYWRDDEQVIRRYFKPGSMLVAGAGAGRTLSHLSAWDITAIDISPEMVAQCRVKGFDAQVMDVQRTTFPAATFVFPSRNIRHR